MGDRLVVVLAKERSDCGGDLRLSDGSDSGAFTEWFGVGANDRDPDIFRAFLIDAVIFPFNEAAAATVVAGDDESGLVFKSGKRLHLRPKFGHVVIELMGAVKDQVVAAGMSPVVSFSIPDEQRTGVTLADVVEQRKLLKRVRDVFAIELCGVAVKIVDDFLARGEIAFVGNVPAGLHDQVAAFFVEDVFVSGPGTVHGDFIMELREFVEPFEDRYIGIAAKFIGVNFRVGVAGEHFVVAGVGEGHAVGDAGDAAFGLIAEDLAFLGNGRPEKRKKQFSTFVDVRAPVVALEVVGFGPDAAVFGVEQSGIGAGENFLPAKAVGNDEDDGFCFSFFLCG